MAQININWHWITYEIGSKWKKDVLPQLGKLEISESDLSSSVYVIRVAGYFAIKYPKAISPVLYIGEGNFKTRIEQHRNWLGNMSEIMSEFPLEIAFCLPKCTGNNHCRHKDTEAAMLHAFKDKFGLAPLKNKQMEYARIDHEYLPRLAFNDAINIGRGVRCDWAIEPMPSNIHYNEYHRV
ncbi:hypothetical protein GEOBRER4_n1258 [Citrifermentans bremense]|uniref:Uncharacterized protein n=1 Tax=Citrifermentans bremense TaxID=60035 RepID=A0A6S6LWW7_9BACT|nr:hypothetical protein [Citrifermentans bremense]BCG46462.1 hypothetical protein GEOBRER4_n1258 [Citrifermentans bremense]